MEPVYVRMLGEPGGSEEGARDGGGKRELIEIDGEEEEGLLDDMMRERVLLRVEVDGLGRKIFTVRGMD